MTPVLLLDQGADTLPERTLDDWPTDAAHALEALQRFAHLRKKFGNQYDLHLTLYGVPVRRSEINEVLNADDKVTAARTLITKKVNFWD